MTIKSAAKELMVNDQKYQKVLHKRDELHQRTKNAFTILKKADETYKKAQKLHQKLCSYYHQIDRIIAETQFRKQQELQTPKVKEKKSAEQIAKDLFKSLPTDVQKKILADLKDKKDGF